MNKTLLCFDSVGLAYKRKLSLFSAKDWVLQNLSFKVYEGEVLGVIGKNGAGKSSLLRLMTNLISPDAGRIDRKKGTHAQLLTLNLGFLGKLSGHENILLSLVTHGLTISQAKAISPEVIAFSGISKILDHPVNTYSAGEKARLGFAIAIHSTPDILLLDEMLGVGDQEFKNKSSKALEKIVTSNQTAVLVSHSTATIEKFCERTLWLENGRLKMLDSTDKVISEYLKAN